MSNGKSPAVRMLRLFLRGCESRPAQLHLITSI